MPRMYESTVAYGIECSSLTFFQREESIPNLCAKLGSNHELLTGEIKVAVDD